MNVQINPKPLGGRVKAIASKSHAHRLLLGAALCGIGNGHTGSCKVHISEMNEDLEATKNCIARLKQTEPVFFCNESGSTLRFFLPIAMALKERAEFWGAGRLPERPLSPLKEEMERHGCVFGSDSSGTGAPELPPQARHIITAEGRLQSGRYSLAGNISSQYITGLLFALPLLDGDSILDITSPLESAGYVDLTLEVLKLFGIRIQIFTCQPIPGTQLPGNPTPENRDSENQPTDFGLPVSTDLQTLQSADAQSCNTQSDSAQPNANIRFVIKGGQSYTSPGEVSAEGDWSNAAFWIAADLLGRTRTPESADISCTGVECTGLNPDSSQGDKRIVEFADIIKENVNTSEILQFDVSQVPDLVPILSVMCCCRRGGTSKIVNAGRLRIKESDRLATVHEMLEALGAEIEEGEDSLTIYGKGSLTGGTVDGHNDHRIVMAAAASSVLCREPVTILGAEAVNKSYPAFWSDFRSLGGEYIEL
ncbi:MAG: 3-phosphoshikimate 1-carboxyvinyltransferase [Anaerovoracaceae bacterium]